MRASSPAAHGSASQSTTPSQSHSPHDSTQVRACAGALPYMITLDSHRGCVVLSLRGTLTMQDLVTDLILDPVPLDTWLPAAFLQVGHCSCTYVLT